MLALWDSFKPASGAPPWIASRALASQNVEARPLLAQFHELTSSFLGVVALHLSFVPADEVFWICTRESWRGASLEQALSRMGVGSGLLSW